MTMKRRSALQVAPIAAALLVACTADEPVNVETSEASFARAGYDTPAVHRQYGTPSKLGNGMARAYVVVSSGEDRKPIELGVAVDAIALDGLPTTGMPVMLRLQLPRLAPEPYEFVMFNWNSHGHEPEGVYNLPHFDFHFYTVPEKEVDGIVPSDPDFAANANDVPEGDFLPAFYSLLAGPGDPPSAVAVPQMGVHWIDVRSPELQGIFGNPGGFETFTKTFIYGSWDGRLTFLEPMITHAYLLTQPEEVVPVPQPARYPQAGWYPSAYSISFDAQAREYRIALVDLSWHD
jgi:hypothetical protein